MSMGQSETWAETFAAMSHEDRVMTIVEDGSTLDALIEEAAERDRLVSFVDNLIAGRYFGGGWADKIIAAAKEARG